MAALACACTASAPTAVQPPEVTAAAVVVPRLWDAAALADWATPVAGLGLAPSFVSEADYYAAPLDNLRTYPVYHPDREPPGYRESLLRAGPQPLIEPALLASQADWIAAGKRVFEELDTISSRSDDPRVIAHFTSAAAIDQFRDAQHDVMDADGVLLDYRWVVDRDRTLKLSLTSCAGCHTRLMPDGSRLAGAPANFDLSDAPAVNILLQLTAIAPGLSAGEDFYAQYGVPWRADDVHARFKSMDDKAIGAFMAQKDGTPPGAAFARFSGSPFFPTRMADLRGLRHRRYLDATGTHQNRGPADIARYGILVEFAESTTFGPYDMLPGLQPRVRARAPDEAMYAMALYLESLEPAPSPFPSDALSRRGAEVFEEQECAKCHSPPEYTDNKLIPVGGFEPPSDDPATARLNISERRVHTDPALALQTRKGTGYYRVPTLRGLWYRGLYGHSGSVTSLEDWFDPQRLHDEYVPSGWHGRGMTHGAVRGHEFGLDLDDEDRRALIAFLRTL